MKYMLRKIMALAMVVLTIGAVSAQTNFADVRVKAKDQDGRNLSGVKIVMLLNNIEVASDTTDSDGNVGFPTLAPGKYEVRQPRRGILISRSPTFNFRRVQTPMKKSCF